MLEEFREYLTLQAKSKNTTNSYYLHIKGYYQWYLESFGRECSVLYRENILDYISYLRNIKKDNGRTINCKISALIKYNKFLVANGIQQDQVVSKNDNIKIQQKYANPSDVTKQEVDAFRQQLLQDGHRDIYCLATLLAYAGLRISEALNIQLTDFNLTVGELKVRGKGDKDRVVYLNYKIINSIREYLRVRESESPYLFANSDGKVIHRSTVNKVFNKYSDKITPHSLRHYFCTIALESGLSVHEVAYLAGHSNVHTTLIYLNPSREAIRYKMSQL
ncbi:tyrosine-type recombinase/integrase [Caloramator sp.]|uniref:tyrosine-type recombinase/integrase n=1 Tax=Caloramator sp. TaxID=1871330 RepID=UPI0025BFABDE|nr:tyrosine-type recombinase/integrase [Caloramator sp.]